METLQALLLVAQVLCAVALIAFILVQHGKGADAGAAFGSGASTTVFGAAGSGNFLTKTTTALAFLFLLNSLALAWMAKQQSIQAGRLNVVEPAPVEQPVQQAGIVLDENPPETEPVGIVLDENPSETEPVGIVLDENPSETEPVEIVLDDAQPGAEPIEIVLDDAQPSAEAPPDDGDLPRIPE